MSCKGGGYKRSFRKHFESNNKHKPHLVMWHLHLEKSIWPSPKCPRPVNIHTLWKVTEAIMIPGVISLMYRIISIKTPNRVNHTESSDSNTLHKGKCWQRHMLWLEGDSQVWNSNKWGQLSQLGIKYMDACGSRSAVLLLEYFGDTRYIRLLMDYLSRYNGAHIVKRQKCWWFFFSWLSGTSIRSTVYCLSVWHRKTPSMKSVLSYIWPPFFSPS